MALPDHQNESHPLKDDDTPDLTSHPGVTNPVAYIASHNDTSSSGPIDLDPSCEARDPQEPASDLSTNQLLATEPVRFLRRKVPTSLVVASFILLVGLAITHWLLSPSPFYKMAPGPVIGLPAKITGATSPSKPGGISYVTVQAVNLDWAQYLWATQVHHETNIVSANSLGTKSDLALAASQMTQAKQDAAVVAYYMLTGKYYAKPAGSTILAVEPHSPAFKAGFIPGDVIYAVNSHPTLTTLALISATKSSKGRTLRFSVLTPDNRRINISAAPVLLQGVYRIGANITAYTTPALPKTTPKIDTTGVDGPSGGLMFTLALVDSLSPGDLTAGHRLAGTGTISSTPGAIGLTGPIGDVSFKVAAAIAAHDQVFFVDPYDYTAAVAAAHNEITVVPVANVYSAIVWLCHAGATDRICSELPLVQSRLATNPLA